MALRPSAAHSAPARGLPPRHDGRPVPFPAARLSQGAPALPLVSLLHSLLRSLPAGHVSSPSCLAYVDDGKVFVGSRSGDSQLVRISETPVNQVRRWIRNGRQGNLVTGSDAAFNEYLFQGPAMLMCKEAWK